MRKRLKTKVRPRTYLINGDHVTAVSVSVLGPKFVTEFSQTLASFTSSMAYFESAVDVTTREMEMMNKAMQP